MTIKTHTLSKWEENKRRKKSSYLEHQIEKEKKSWPVLVIIFIKSLQFSFCKQKEWLIGFNGICLCCICNIHIFVYVYILSSLRNVFPLLVMVHMSYFLDWALKKEEQKLASYFFTHSLSFDMPFMPTIQLLSSFFHFLLTSIKYICFNI